MAIRSRKPKVYPGHHLFVTLMILTSTRLTNQNLLLNSSANHVNQEQDRAKIPKMEDESEVEKIEETSKPVQFTVHFMETMLLNSSVSVTGKEMPLQASRKTNYSTSRNGKRFHTSVFIHPTMTTVSKNVTIKLSKNTWYKSTANVRDHSNRGNTSQNIIASTPQSPLLSNIVPQYKDTVASTFLIDNKTDTILMYQTVIQTSRSTTRARLVQNFSSTRVSDGKKTKVTSTTSNSSRLQSRLYHSDIELDKSSKFSLTSSLSSSSPVMVQSEPPAKGTPFISVSFTNRMKQFSTGQALFTSVVLGSLSSEAIFLYQNLSTMRTPSASHSWQRAVSSPVVLSSVSSNINFFHQNLSTLRTPLASSSWKNFIESKSPEIFMSSSLRLLPSPRINSSVNLSLLNKGISTPRLSNVSLPTSSQTRSILTRMSSAQSFFLPSSSVPFSVQLQQPLPMLTSMRASLMSSLAITSSRRSFTGMSTSKIKDIITNIPTTKAPLRELPLVLIGRSKTTIAARFDLSRFNMKKVQKLDVVIQRYDKSTIDFEGMTALPPVTWFQVHYMVKYSYRRYIATSICLDPFACNRHYKPTYGHKSRQKRQLSKGLLTFHGGEKKGCENQMLKSHICNGPLEPGTMYRFQVLIHYTDSSHISTTPFSRPVNTLASITDASKTTEQPVASADQTMLVIIVIAVLIVLLLVILAFVVIARKRNGRHGPYGTNSDLKCALISSFRNHPSCSCTQSGAVEQGFQLRPISKGMSRPVSVKDFQAWVMRSSADSDFRFAEEFESIRDVGRDQSHEYSDMPENRGKNRYVNVLAYDHTRVKLSYTDDEAGSDYINANYIHGYNRPRAYIATQGPLPGTTDDFWRMTWEQNSHLIVMITQLTERARVKCHKYWPATEPTTYGDITVTLLSDYSFPNWCEKELLLEVEGEEPRRIHQFQYSSWPDHGVPKTTLDILEFQSTIQSHCLSSHGPMIVHCSAGVGRTGTFIAIDTIIKRLQEETVLDIYGTVCLMRLQRCSMVQTEDQYIYIHRAILEYIRQREMNTHIFKGYSLLPLEERGLLDSDRGSEDTSIAPSSPLLDGSPLSLTLSPLPVRPEEEASLL